MPSYRTAINQTLRKILTDYPHVVLIGQSIRDPYGGSCKVTRGLTKDFDDRVIDTPISEAAQIGIANGMALNGKVPIVEIMFSDFMTLCVDQIFNVAFKIYQHHQQDFKVIIRTMWCEDKMYGPTHCQSMHWLFAALERQFGSYMFHNTGLTTDFEYIYRGMIENNVDLYKAPVHIIVERKSLYDKEMQ